MTLPEKMTAIEIAAPGGPEALVPVERPVPRPGPGEVLVRVAAAGVNRPDVMQRQGTTRRRPARRTSQGSRSRARSSKRDRARPGCRTGSAPSSRGAATRSTASPRPRSAFPSRRA